MATVGAGDPGRVEIAAVGVRRIAFMAVFQYDIVIFLLSRQRELAFAVSYPYSEARPRKRIEQYRPALRLDIKSDESRLELMAVIMQHSRHKRFSIVYPGYRFNCVALSRRFYQPQFDHQLTTVAETQRKSVGTRIETLERAPGLLVVEERAGPALGRTAYVGV